MLASLFGILLGAHLADDEYYPWMERELGDHGWHWTEARKIQVRLRRLNKRGLLEGQYPPLVDRPETRDRNPLTVFLEDKDD